MSSELNPYLIAIALIEQEGVRFMPLGGKSVKNLVEYEAILIRTALIIT